MAPQVSFTSMQLPQPAAMPSRLLLWGAWTCQVSHKDIPPYKFPSLAVPGGVRAASCSDPIRSDDCPCHEQSEGYTTTGLWGWVPSEGLGHPGNAEELLKSLKEPLAPPGMKGQW